MQEEKRQLRSMFDSLDVSHDGQISASELRSGLQRVGVSLSPHYGLVGRCAVAERVFRVVVQLGMSEEAISEFLGQVDIDHSGQIGGHRAQRHLYL